MVKIADVAKLAGVSPITVSRVINKTTPVREATRQKVQEAINELGYVPNLVARSLATNQTKTVGVLLTNLENPIYASYLSGIAETARIQGYDMIIYSAVDYDNALTGVNVLLSKQVDGFIILPLESNQRVTAASSKLAVTQARDFYIQFNQIAGAIIEQQNKPFVLIGHHHLNDKMTFISDDYKEGARMAVGYLVSQGHKQIGFMGHAMFEEGIWGERRAGYFEAMKQNGLEVRESFVLKALHTVEDSYLSMSRFLTDCTELPTAIYCSNDIMAVGVINACKDHGVCVPKALSVIGHDGSTIGESVVPSLTTVSICPHLTGQTAFMTILKLLRQEKDAEKDVIIPPELVERQSVCRPNK